MKTIIFYLKKHVLIIFAVIISLLISLDQWVVIIKHQNNPNYPIQDGLWFIICQMIYTASLAWIIWYINISSKIKPLILKILVSTLITILFVCFAQLAEPHANRLNEIVYPFKKEKKQNKSFSEKTYYITNQQEIKKYYHDDWNDWTIKTIILFFICNISGLVYTLKKRNTEIEYNFEKLQNEALHSKLNALTNQINPHFFFNSLNSLYSLVFNDHKSQSLEYITKMSDVFRYILQSEQKRLVPLNEELSFLNTYLFMLLIKFDKKLSIVNKINCNTESYQLPVLSILPLIENVIKHNEISNQHPMVIDIYINNDEQLVISNPKRERLDSSSNGTGLKNLSNRYLLITQKDICIEDLTDTFIVQLPLIKTNKNEYTYH